METLADTTWDAIICGTGLQQSLLALALSRSGKQILHLDPNDYYGGDEAALSLQDADAWVEEQQKKQALQKPVFTAASVSKEPDDSASGSESRSRLSFPRAYSLALAPFIIYTRSALLSQLVSSRAFRQLEFLAVGSYFIFQPASAADASHPTLTPIPSTREAIFANTAIGPRPKRVLMKFLKFVLEHEAEPQVTKWQPAADRPLDAFLQEDFKLDAELRTLILALTLSLDGKITVRDGLKAIERHLTSMGMFGPGFAAVYPKWGGGSEIAQVGCRGLAVGGGVYMLGTGVKTTRQLADDTDGAKVEVELGDAAVKVKTRMLFRGSEEASEDNHPKIARLVAIVDSPLESIFLAATEDAPTPAVAVLILPAGSLKSHDAPESSQYPVFAFAHSSETGECPSGQSVLYLTTLATPNSTMLLDEALGSVLSAVAKDEGDKPQCLYRLRYEQSSDSGELKQGDGDGIYELPLMYPDLAFNDGTLAPVKDAWIKAADPSTSGEADSTYMTFQDREGMGDEDD